MVSPSFPVGPFDTTHGSLAPLRGYMGQFHDFFWTAYDDRKWETGYSDDLPLVKRHARMSIVECDEIIVILSWPSHTIGREGHTYPRDQYPELAEMGVYEIAKSRNLGQVIDYRPFPLQHDRIKAIRENTATHEDNLKATALVQESAEQWAREIADEHIARTHPDFEEAKHRMTQAYEILFELEHFLRAFIEHTLETKHGTEWWMRTSIDPNIRGAVKRNQRDPRNNWFDEYDPSILRFTEFDHLRKIILANFSDFEPTLGQGAKAWLDTLLTGVSPLRNRVGHVNTLSSDDFHDFLRDANRLIDTCRPHIQLR